MESTRWLSDGEQRAWRGLQNMQMRLGGELARQLASGSGLSIQDYGVLVALADHEDGAMRLFELGQEMGWEKSRLSHHIARMAKRGLVSKESCETDRRGATVVLTEQGNAELVAAAPGHVEAVRRLFIDQLSAKQIEALAEISETIIAAIDSIGPAVDRCDG